MPYHIVNRHKVDGKWEYQCAMCGKWSNHTDHIANHPNWFKYIWDIWNVGQMMGSASFSVITMHNMTKPFVCVQCMVNESGPM